MSEFPKPPISETSRTPEIPDVRSRVIGAFNRTLDRMQHERDGIMNKVKSDGPGFLTDRDRGVVLGHDYAVEGAKKVSGSTRLTDSVKSDLFEVEVEDRQTKMSYKRKEGIPVGGMIKYLVGERARLDSLANSASSEGRYMDASELRTESSRLFNDQMTLTMSSQGTSSSLLRDWRDDSVPAKVKEAAKSDPDYRTIEYYERNRIGTEANLRSLNEVIRELGGESQDENWKRAAKDILEDRRELEIPSKSSEVFGLPPTVPVELALAEGVSASDAVTIATEGEKVPETRVTALAVPEKYTSESIKVYVPGEDSLGSKSSASDFAKGDDGKIIPWSEADRGGRGPRRDSFGILEKPTSRREGDRGSSEGIIIEGSARDVTEKLKKERRDDPGRDILEAALAKMGSGRARIKSFVGKLPKPGLKKALTWLGVAAGAAGVMLAQDNNRDVSMNTTGIGTGLSPVEGLAKPATGSPVWEPESIPPGLTVSESARPNVEKGNNSGYKRVEVEIPGQGKRNIDVKILTGNEDYIFNVPASGQTPENRPSPVTVSGAEVRRTLENPQANDETAKMIRSYLDEETIKLVKSLPENRYLFATRGPQGELLKEDYASIKGAFDAKWAETALGRPFDMRSIEDLAKLQEAKNTPEYKRAWKVTVADRLLRSLDPLDFGITGFLTDGREFTDLVVSTPSNHGYKSRDVSSLYKGGQP